MTITILLVVALIVVVPGYYIMIKQVWQEWKELREKKNSDKESL